MNNTKYVRNILYWHNCHGDFYIKNGDFVGFNAFNGNLGLVTVIANGEKKYLTRSTNVVNFDNAKAVAGVNVEEIARIELKQDVIYRGIDGDFNLNKDLATVSYSGDNKIWITTRNECKMA